MDPETLNSIHDRVFKGSMERNAIARGLSQLFLPERISFKIDYSSLYIEKNSGINSKLIRHSSDILYRAKIEGSRKTVLLLFEHKSYLDKAVNLQNYRNISEIIGDVRNHLKSNKQKLPPVLPIIFYHGKKAWNVDNSMQPMFEVIKGTEKFLPQQERIVIDLGTIPDEKFQGIAEVRAFILALKYSRSPLLFEKMPEIIHLFDGVGAQRLEYLEVLITYLSYVTEECDRGELSKIVKRELDLGDDIMKKNSSIWAELGYWAGLEDAKSICLKKGENIWLKKGERIGLKKGEDIGLKKGERIGLKKGEGIGLKKGEGIGLKKGEGIGLKKGERIGLKKGERIGLKKSIAYEKKLKRENEKQAIKNLESTALKMLNKGISIEEISEFTGLSIKEILVLKRNVKNKDL